MREMMKKAHEMAREIKSEYPEVDYRFQFSLCLKSLKETKEETKEETKRTLIAKDWILNKVAQEKRKNIVENKIFAVTKETEKAYQVILVGAGLRAISTWLPKAAVEEIETEKETLFEDYEKAMMHFNSEMNFYR